MANKPENFIFNLHSKELNILICKKLLQINKGKTRARLGNLQKNKSKVIQHITQNIN